MSIKSQFTQLAIQEVVKACQEKRVIQIGQSCQVQNLGISDNCRQNFRFVLLKNINEKVGE